MNAADLATLLELETLEVNLFRGHQPPKSWLARSRVFGGQVLAQALVAAQRTVDGITAHSMHAYFLLGGDPAMPIIYDVERVRDGRSFATRRVVAIQNGRPIFIMSVSFHHDEGGYDHQLPLPPDIPEPEQLPDIGDLTAAIAGSVPEKIRAYWTRPRPVELRPVSLDQYGDGKGSKGRPFQQVWFRARGELPADPALHQAVLAYASDMTLLETTLVAHGTSVLGENMQSASLDHALWLHRPFLMDDWLLYAQDSPSASGALGLARGLIYDRAGRLIASVAQEGLIRPLGKLKN